MLDEPDPTQIDDPTLREQFVALLNVLEKALGENSLLKVEVQRLKDEITCLKGGQGRPLLNQLKTKLLFPLKISLGKVVCALAELFSSQVEQHGLFLWEGPG